MNAAGTAYPPPDTATGTLNIIAASGAAPVTMQNSTWGNPSAFLARPPDSWTGVTADGASVTGLMRPPATGRWPPREHRRNPRRRSGCFAIYRSVDLGAIFRRASGFRGQTMSDLVKTSAAGAAIVHPMSASETHTHHAIDYIELTVTDMDAAKAFYTSAFGWSLADYGPEYAGIQGDGSEQGGLRLDSAGAGRRWRSCTRRTSKRHSTRWARPAGRSCSRSSPSRAVAGSTSAIRPATSSPRGRIALDLQERADLGSHSVVRTRAEHRLSIALRVVAGVLFVATVVYVLGPVVGLAEDFFREPRSWRTPRSRSR